MEWKGREVGESKGRGGKIDLNDLSFFKREREKEIREREERGNIGKKKLMVFGVGVQIFKTKMIGVYCLGFGFRIEVK